MNKIPQYLTEKQVAKMTNLSLDTLRKYRSQGKGIPYSKMERSVRYLLDDAINFMEQRRIKTEDMFDETTA